MTKKKSEPNPIEEAIGERAKPKEKLSETDLQKVNQDVKKAVVEKVAGMENPRFPTNPSEIADVPSPQEMLSLEELNRRTEDRLLSDDRVLDEKLTQEERREQRNPKIPVSKPDPQPVTKTSSQESPPQKKVDNITAWKCPDCGLLVRDNPSTHLPCRQHRNEAIKPPAEEKELTALRKYILEDGFVVATVAFHIVSLCAQPMTTPSTTMWDFKDRAMIPEMVLALLNQPGYLEGIWPSLRIVMGSNKGNAAWSAGIATTIAFFDTIRVLPSLKELEVLKNEEKP